MLFRAQGDALRFRQTHCINVKTLSLSGLTGFKRSANVWASIWLKHCAGKFVIFVFVRQCQPSMFVFHFRHDFKLQRRVEKEAAKEWANGESMLSQRRLRKGRFFSDIAGTNSPINLLLRNIFKTIRKASD